MCRIIDRLASDKGFVREDANYVFNFVTKRIIDKIPSLRQIIEDVFEESDRNKLKDEVGTSTMTQKQQQAEPFKAWRMPVGSTIRQTGCKYIL